LPFASLCIYSRPVRPLEEQVSIFGPREVAVSDAVSATYEELAVK
jgi:hypothetical protein